MLNHSNNRNKWINKPFQVIDKVKSKKLLQAYGYQIETSFNEIKTRARSLISLSPHN
jgi:hypothetical protein